MAQRARAGLARDDLAAGRARPHSPWSAGGWQVLRAGVALLLVACTTQPALIPPTTTPHSSPAATRPTLSPPLPTPPLPPPTAAPIELPGFVTALPPDPGAPWTAIVWRRLAADDPLGGVRSVVRWREGFLAIGAVAVTGETSGTPV